MLDKDFHSFIRSFIQRFLYAFFHNLHACIFFFNLLLRQQLFHQTFPCELTIETLPWYFFSWYFSYQITVQRWKKNLLKEYRPPITTIIIIRVLKIASAI